MIIQDLDLTDKRKFRMKTQRYADLVGGKKEAGFTYFKKSNQKTWNYILSSPLPPAKLQQQNIVL